MNIGFLYFNEEWNKDTKSPTDDAYGDIYEDGIDDIIRKKDSSKTIED